MFHHLRAILLASGTLIALGTLHSISTAMAGTAPGTSRVLLLSQPEQLQSAQVRSLTGASVRAVAIGF